VSAVQWAVIAFFVSVWLALAAILVAAPEIYWLTGAGVVPVAFFSMISVIVVVGVIGVARRWRWVFWLVLVAFLAGALRVVASALELGGVIPFDAPRWYMTLQGAIGIVQLAIGIAMLRSYRRAGMWGRATER